MVSALGVKAICEALPNLETLLIDRAFSDDSTLLPFLSSLINTYVL